MTCDGRIGRRGASVTTASTKPNENPCLNPEDADLPHGREGAGKVQQPQDSPADLTTSCSLDPVLVGASEADQLGDYGLGPAGHHLVRPVSSCYGINTVKNLALSSAVLHNPVVQGISRRWDMTASGGIPSASGWRRRSSRRSGRDAAPAEEYSRPASLPTISARSPSTPCSPGSTCSR
jgi:hypothetical protein